MENISTVIKALFEKVGGDEILEAAGYINGQKLLKEVFHLDTSIKESTIVNKLLQVDNDSTIDQLTMLCQIVQFKWMEQDENCIDLKFKINPSVFNILLYFSAKCLSIKDGDPLCQYQYLLRWHLLTTQVGEDLLTTSFLASRDLILDKERKSFDWASFVGHDCKELNYIFEKPMAELHMHLKGSSFNFDLSWICLMNHIGIMQKHFEIEHPYFKYKGSSDDLFESVRKACAIRYYLAGACGCLPQTITLAELQRILNDNELVVSKEQVVIEAYKISLQEKLDSTFANTHSRMLEKYGKLAGITDDDVIDYIPVNHYEKEPIENKVLASERSLMYSVFRSIYSDDCGERKDIATLFYAYLSYKNHFRNEVMQLNDRVGFANFASFEERKTDYMIENQYNHLLYKAALEGFLEKGKGLGRKDTNRFIEARIVPKNTEEGIIKSLALINKEIAPEYWDHYNFIFHFIKKRDEPKEDDKYQHYKLREEIRQQAYAIYKFRSNRDNWTNNNLVGKVVGLDAANSEIFCRPEIYAQAFRFLRGHEVKINEEIDDYPNDLRITYHVGEDFMDIADGLRAVEEALIFLNLKNGDRLGHALVLGTDVREYYARRYYSICASKQVILDNLAWLHHKCIRLIGYTQLCGWIDIMFLRYFSEIYNDARKPGQTIIDSLFKEKPAETLPDDIEDYYLSWLLRGNSPIVGTELDSESMAKKSTIDKQWSYAALNHNVGSESALKNENARQLFDAYHSPRYANKRNIGETLSIPQIYREEWNTLLEKIQQHLLEKIEQRHIAIECNPSSNFKIGEIERYDQHPIVRFFNYGLNTPYPRHDISVSINTDDQGIFSTSLEREFSLMALAIERNQTEQYQNSPRAIIEWLDRVREMSMEQRFNY